MSKIYDLLSDISEELKRLGKSPDDLWDTEDIGNYLKLKKSTVQQTIITKNGFPKPVFLPTSVYGKGGKRWIPKEVKAWTLRQKA